MTPLSQYRSPVYVSHDPLNEEDKQLFDYLENNRTATKSTVTELFGSLARRNAAQESLAHVALRCNRVAAAGWLVQNAVPDLRDESKVPVSKETGPYPTNSILGYMTSYCPAAIRYFPSFLFFDTLFENKTDNEISIGLISGSEKERIEFAEKYGYALSALRLNDTPLIDSMIESGTWDVVKFLIRYGVRVDDETRKAYRLSPQKDEKFYEDYLCQPLSQTVVYEDLVEKREQDFIRHLHRYSGNLNERVTVKGKRELFFIQVLRCQNESMIQAFLDFAEKTSRDLGIQAGSIDALKAVEIAKQYPSYLQMRVQKIAHANSFLSMEDSERQAYLEKHGTGELFNADTPLLVDCVEQGDFALGKLLVEHGAKVDATVMQAYANSAKKDVKFFEEYLSDPLSKTRLYAALSAHEVQRFCTLMALYCGDVNVQLRAGSNPSPFLILILREGNPLVLGTFLRRANELNQKIAISPHTPEMAEVQAQLKRFSNELQAEVNNALGNVVISLPFFMLVLKERNPATLEEFIRKSKESRQKIKVNANSAEMREIQALLKEFPKELQALGTGIVEIAVSPLSISDRSNGFKHSPRLSSGLASSLERASSLKHSPRVSSGLAMTSDRSSPRIGNMLEGSSEIKASPRMGDGLAVSSGIASGKALGGGALKLSLDRVPSLGIVAKMKKVEVRKIIKEFWEMLINPQIDITPEMVESIQEISKEFIFDAPDLNQLDHFKKDHFAEWLREGEAYLMWLDFVFYQLDEMEEEKIKPTINTILSVQSKNGQYLIHLLLANLDFRTLIWLRPSIGQQNVNKQNAFEYCQSLPLIRRTPQQSERPSTPRSAIHSPRLTTLRNSPRQSENGKVGISSKPELLYVSNNEYTQRIFREFPEWNEEDQKVCICTQGLDSLQLGDQSLLAEMISRKHWKEAKLLTEYGARVDSNVLAAYEKVRDDNPKFKTEMLDCAMANSRLVKHLKSKNREKILKFIKIYQRDFCEQVTIGKVTAPLYLFLLRLNEPEIGDELTERLFELQQAIEIVEGTGVAFETTQLKELYVKDLPVQFKSKPSIPMIDLSKLSQDDDNT